eukprot:991296_1
MVLLSLKLLLPHLLLYCCMSKTNLTYYGEDGMGSRIHAIMCAMVVAKHSPNQYDFYYTPLHFHCANNNCERFTHGMSRENIFQFDTFMNMAYNENIITNKTMLKNTLFNFITLNLKSKVSLNPNYYFDTNSLQYLRRKYFMKNANYNFYNIEFN